ncbi:MAG: hypothetical protein LBM56_03170 [Burkholderiaceae bacterium]|jgi:hypothetical protein|nr:hypothetical protein [Burkholderiaceae bacterium]
MLFFWRQPVWQSELDGLLQQLAKDDPALPEKKTAGLDERLETEPFDPVREAREKASLLPFPATPYP